MKRLTVIVNVISHLCLLAAILISIYPDHNVMTKGFLYVGGISLLVVNGISLVSTFIKWVRDKNKKP